MLHSYNHVVATDEDKLEPDLINSNIIDREAVGNTLAFALANHGYDVWMPNYRGTLKSLEHEKWTAYDEEYWNFCVDDLALDARALVDYVNDATGKQQVGYIGLSQGNTMMFALLSARPEYNDKLKPFIALAPVTVTPHTFPTLSPTARKLIANTALTLLLRKPGPLSGPLWMFKLFKWAFTSHPFTRLTNVIMNWSIQLFGGGDFDRSRAEFFASRDGGLSGRKTLG